MLECIITASETGRMRDEQIGLFIVGNKRSWDSQGGRLRQMRVLDFFHLSFGLEIGEDECQTLGGVTTSMNNGIIVFIWYCNSKKRTRKNRSIRLHHHLFGSLQRFGMCTSRSELQSRQYIPCRLLQC